MPTIYYSNRGPKPDTYTFAAGYVAFDVIWVRNKAFEFQAIDQANGHFVQVADMPIEYAGECYLPPVPNEAVLAPAFPGRI